jgi:hypothetical protein
VLFTVYAFVRGYIGIPTATLTTPRLRAARGSCRAALDLLALLLVVGGTGTVKAVEEGEGLEALSEVLMTQNFR